MTHYTVYWEYSNISGGTYYVMKVFLWGIYFNVIIGRVKSTVISPILVLIRLMVLT